MEEYQDSSFMDVKECSFADMKEYWECSFADMKEHTFADAMPQCSSSDKSEGTSIAAPSQWEGSLPLILGFR